MAGASPPFYMPLLWPVGHVSSAISIPDDYKPPKPVSEPYLDITGHLTSAFGAFRASAIAYFCIYGLYGEGQYPAFGRAAALEWSWMWPILVRNLVATWMICGLWDWFLYFSPLSAKLHKYKLNPDYPSNRQLIHDSAYTTLASVCGTAVEVGLCHGWASGTIPMQRTIEEAPGKTLLWCLLITHWRIPHFWMIHRCMHPWRNPYLPDIGRFLYKHVHSLHHKSYNPTAFSGTSMHPAEATAYYSAALIAVPFATHPVVAIGCIVDCAVGAWLGHDGFQWPGSGDYFHQIHHAHFDCNFGASHIPIDWLLGTYAGSRAEMKQIWRKESDLVGTEGNETAVHPKAA